MSRGARHRQPTDIEPLAEYCSHRARPPIDRPGSLLSTDLAAERSASWSGPEGPQYLDGRGDHRCPVDESLTPGQAAFVAGAVLVLVHRCLPSLTRSGPRKEGPPYRFGRSTWGSCGEAVPSIGQSPALDGPGDHNFWAAVVIRPLNVGISSCRQVGPRVAGRRGRSGRSRLSRTRRTASKWGLSYHSNMCLMQSFESNYRCEKSAMRPHG